MTVAVLDASAVLALVLDEPGANRVRQIVNQSAIITINLAEVAAVLARGGLLETDIRDLLGAIPAEVVDFDQELAYATAMLAPITRQAGLSLGERACLALARRLNVKAMTTDRAWATVSSAARVSVELIR